MKRLLCWLRGSHDFAQPVVDLVWSLVWLEFEVCRRCGVERPLDGERSDG